MIYKDFVYGELEINEPVLLELINCQSIQRLKEIDQAGYPPLWAKQTPTVDHIEHTRFKHSIGVMLLLKKYGAKIEEQIAGLIHDVSHSAFSHAVDYVVKNGTEHNQGHQDDVFDEYVKKTEIPNILDKYGYRLDFILNDLNFQLKERDLPDLCADRIDYVLRSSLFFNETNKEETKYILDNLFVEDNQWLFKNSDSAKKFSKIFDNMNRVYYSGLKSATMFVVTSDYLRYAVEQKYINFEDLYLTDKKVIDKINSNLNDKVLNKLWKRMNGEVSVKNNLENFDTETICKSRVVDPLFVENGKIKRVSEIDPEWAKTVETESKPKKYYLKFED